MEFYSPPKLYTKEFLTPFLRPAFSSHSIPTSWKEKRPYSEGLPGSCFTIVTLWWGFFHPTVLSSLIYEVCTITPLPPHPPNSITNPSLPQNCVCVREGTTRVSPFPPILQPPSSPPSRSCPSLRSYPPSSLSLISVLIHRPRVACCSRNSIDQGH